MLQKSKAEELREQLLSRIENMKSGERLMPIRQIMRDYGVSQLIVDQALSRFEADGQLEKKPGKGVFVRDTDSARELKVGFLVPDWPSQNFIELEEMLKAVSDGMQVTRASYPVGSAVCDNLPVKDYDAIILIPEDRHFTPEFLYKISNASIPVVLCGVSLRDVLVNCVAEDPYSAGGKAASYLIGQGHRKLSVVISEPRNASIIEARLAGFKMLAELSGCEITVIDCEICNGEYSPEKTYAKLSSWLNDNAPKFTAMYVMSDETALAAMRALSDHGIVIPDQVSVLGTDGLRQGAFYHPPLTTLGIEYRELAEALCDVIKNACDDRSRVFRKFIPPGIIERSSVANI